MLRRPAMIFYEHYFAGANGGCLYAKNPGSCEQIETPRVGKCRAYPVKQSLSGASQCWAQILYVGKGQFAASQCAAVYTHLLTFALPNFFFQSRLLAR